MTTAPNKRPPRAKATQKQLEETIVDVDVLEDDERDFLPIVAPSADVALVEPTVDEIAERVTKARHFMKVVMKRGIEGDYAVIPYCGDKPALLKPGAEKLARLFGLSHETERTMFERLNDGEFLVAYRTVVRDVHGRTIGDVESLAESTEKSFRDRHGKLVVPMNTVFRRCAKRSYVGAIVQATGVSDLFSTGNEGPELLDGRQQSIIIALVSRGNPKLAEATVAQAARTRVGHWEPYLRSAIDAITEDEAERTRLFDALIDDDATAATVAELLDGDA